ncbi:protein translocase subunit SecF [Clostridium saccharobutylicum]|uniref:Protein-export membrane protein SecF n=1 Tax=Clostridium saccharobutylicum DSM 13864 TaxID=1345695 RepID=U5MTB5_CLOSA|nr:protein translocase subunit SecF [Clostridium saccharobutylicum]AGX43840.1 protein translocase subunit SecF [Clostridium saccharobutylicum DSM 13864]AQR91140.1 protein-export membrane protein SecF [Clostridium saccharobutylicum]AQS01044.1 protein-export membrane protein SecF [Clostridium saccharobutylicum]AQS10780.1 protein-export membrane protein SecF [Clostridium saccharobutylicum]AQS15027.1 protein-export membrane protein SecF [Clostridium saccharobutylicum]
MFKIIEKSKILISISLIVILIGIGFICFRGLNFGIDFKGGTEVSIKLNDSINKEDVDTIVKSYANDANTNISDSYEYEIKSADLDSNKVSSIMNDLKGKYSLEDSALISQNEIGASVGKELTKNSLLALFAAFIVMLIYIAIRFEFKFGVAALIATIHDILITVSVYAIFNIPVNTPFIAAVLTIVGYSMNDTIVIFDRIRENTKIMRRADPTEVANTSLTETMSRSIYTSLSTLMTIIAMDILVPSVRQFTIPLIVGIIAGAYSSIFIASPVWVYLKDRIKDQKKKLQKA